MISLITATFGRVYELQVLLDSLVKQTYKDFEIIIVDQNAHDLLEQLVCKYEEVLSVKYVRSNIKGLSLNRNIGLKYCSGSIVGFPDDDCFYDSSVLERIINIFDNNRNISFVVSEVKDVNSNNIFIKSNDRVINRKNIFKYCISYNFFIYKNASVSFDEYLGVGSVYGSGEETDYLWALLGKHDIGIFMKGAFIYHPRNEASENYKRAYSYGLGFGAIFKKEIVHRRNYSYMLLYLYHILRTFSGIVVKKHRLFYYYTLKGRIKGFFSFQ